MDAKDAVELHLHNSLRKTDLNVRSNIGWTALMFSCENGQKNVVRLYLDISERNINLIARSNGGSNPLMSACKNGHQDVDLLLNY